MRDVVPTLAIGGGVVVLLAGLLWYVRRRRSERDAVVDDDARGIDRHERFDLGLDLPVPPLPPARPAATDPSPEQPLPAWHKSEDPIAPPPPDPPPAPPLSAPPATERVPFQPLDEMALDAPMVAVVPSAGRATLDITLTPRRAGTNLTGAAVEYDLVVRNAGPAVAANVHVDVRLLSAGVQQDALVNALFAAPIERSITEVFELPPGAEVQLGGMGILPRDLVAPMTVEGRDVFLPVMTVNLTYDWATGSGQTARSFVIGVDRGADARLGAFRLDTAKMFDQVGALEYTIAVNR